MSFLIQQKFQTTCGSVECLRSKAITEKFWRWSRLAPRESQLATGRIVSSLFEHPQGLSKMELLTAATGENISGRSQQYVEALETSVNKRIQRSRKRARPFGLDIVYDRSKHLWFLESVEAPESLAGIRERGSRLSAS